MDDKRPVVQQSPLQRMEQIVLNGLDPTIQVEVEVEEAEEEEDNND